MAEYISFQPSDFYNTTTYTGNGSTQSITGVGFQPDLVWIKNLEATDNQCIADAARGDQGDSYKYIYPDGNWEQSAADTTFLTSLDADGFTVGSADRNNANTEDLASWNWKGGTTSGLSGGTITPSGYSFNTTSGFSAIAYTGNATAGATIPHGLGVAPDMIWVKNTQTAEAWACYFAPLGNTKVLTLNDTNAVLTQAQWNDTSPTSTLFSVGSGGNPNLAETHVAYCFANKTGYSKIGSYVGNGVADGTFVYTGFRPAFLMIKRYDGVASWYVYDDKRLGYNVDNNANRPDADWARDTTDVVDLVSNGFKLRNSGSSWNGSLDDYVYAAFAEFPIVSSNDVPGVAR